MFFFLSFDTFRKSLAKYIYGGKKAEIMYYYFGKMCDPPNFFADQDGTRIETAMKMRQILVLIQISR
jgi:hypothetical protein